MKLISFSLVNACIFWLGMSWLEVQAANTCDETLRRMDPVSRFNLVDDDVVFDTQTRLTWRRCPIGFKHIATSGYSICDRTNDPIPSLKEVLYDIETIEPIGDWRLPGRKEVNSILEPACIPVLNYTLFPPLTKDSDVKSKVIITNYPNVHIRQSGPTSPVQQVNRLKLVDGITYYVFWDGLFSYFEYSQFGLGETAGHNDTYLFYLVSGPQ